MAHYIDITGQKFNRLTVLMDYDKSPRDGSILWKCKCTCGNTILATSTQLKSGDVKSCGCLKREASRKYNKYTIVGDEVLLFDSKGHFAIIDLDDLEKVKPYYWFQSTHGYFVTVTGRKHTTRLSLHNFVFPDPIPDGYEVDHKDRRKFNDTKGNLRLATRSQNNINKHPQKNSTTGFVGVSYMKSRGKYRAYITVDYKQKSLGLFSTPEEAYSARLEAEKKYYGEFTTKGSDD